MKRIKFLSESATLSTWFSFLSKAAINVGLLSLLVVKFDTRLLNVWLLLSVFLSMQTLADVGLSQCFVRSISHARGGAQTIYIHGDGSSGNLLPQPNWRLIGDLLATYRWLVYCLSTAASLILLFVGYYVLKNPLSFLSNPMDGWLAFVLTIMLLVVRMLGNVYTIGLEGLDCVHTSRYIEVESNLLYLILTLCALMIFEALVPLVLAQGLAVLYMIARKRRAMALRFSRLLPSGASYQRDLFRLIRPIAIKSWLGSLFSFGLVQFTGFVVGGTVSPVVSSRYLLTIRALDVLKQIANAPFYSQLPAFNGIFIRGDQKQLLSKARESMLFVYVIFVCGVLALDLFGNRLLYTLGSENSFLPSSLLLVIGAAYFFERYGGLHIQLYSLTNQIVWHKANGITACIFICSFGVFSVAQVDLIQNLCMSLLLANGGFYAWYAASHSYCHYKLRFLVFEKRAVLIPGIVYCLYSIVSFFL